MKEYAVKNKLLIVTLLLLLITSVILVVQLVKSRQVLKSRASGSNPMSVLDSSGQPLPTDQNGTYTSTSTTVNVHISVPISP